VNLFPPTCHAQILGRCWSARPDPRSTRSRSQKTRLAVLRSASGCRTSYAASSIAKIAVSGWLIGSTPTRLTIEVMVPSASASTQAARCSSPR
jgi:hypothetical protein